MKYQMSGYESTKTSRDSKKLPNYFSEYDAYLLEAVDYVDYSFNVTLKKALPREKDSEFLEILNKSKEWRGTFQLIYLDKHVIGITYQTDSILECCEAHINDMCSHINTVIQKKL